MIIILTFISQTDHYTAQRAPSTPHTFSQRLDHFHFSKDYFTKFDQRYYINSNFFQNDTKTMIVEIGGEGEITSAPGGDDVTIDVIGKIAKQHKSMIFALEHRFYGASHPFKTAQNLTFLTSSQALADLANFVDEMDKKYCPEERQAGKMCFKWIVAGGSYPGALTGFALQKLNFMFAAGISSSGVVQAVHSLPEFDQHTYAAAGTPCGVSYEVAIREVESAIESGDLWPLKHLEVGQIESMDDFYYFLADSGVMAFQYGKWKEMCQENLNVVSRLNGNVTVKFLDYVKQNYNPMPYLRENLKKPEISVKNAFRQWWWQTCTEFAYFQPAPMFNSIRSQKVSLQYHYDVCNYAFGLDLTFDKMEDIVERTNNYYGGDSVYGQDTIFTNFWQDVWHMCSITEEKTNAKNFVYIDSRDSGHCADLHGDRPQDPQQLVQMREKVIEFVNQKLIDYRT